MRSFDCSKGHAGQTCSHKVRQGTGCEIINGCFLELDEHLSGMA